jgi:hypothetical protein
MVAIGDAVNDLLSLGLGVGILGAPLALKRVIDDVVDAFALGDATDENEDAVTGYFVGNSFRSVFTDVRIPLEICQTRGFLRKNGRGGEIRI